MDLALLGIFKLLIYGVFFIPLVWGLWDTYRVLVLGEPMGKDYIRMKWRNVGIWLSAFLIWLLVSQFLWTYGPKFELKQNITTRQFDKSILKVPAKTYFPDIKDKDNLLDQEIRKNLPLVPK